MAQFLCSWDKPILITVYTKGRTFLRVPTSCGHITSSTKSSKVPCFYIFSSTCLLCKHSHYLPNIAMAIVFESSGALVLYTKAMTQYSASILFMVLLCFIDVIQCIGQAILNLSSKQVCTQVLDGKTVTTLHASLWSLIKLLVQSKYEERYFCTCWEGTHSHRRKDTNVHK